MEQPHLADADLGVCCPNIQHSLTLAIPLMLGPEMVESNLLQIERHHPSIGTLAPLTLLGQVGTPGTPAHSARTKHVGPGMIEMIGDDIIAGIITWQTCRG